MIPLPNLDRFNGARRIVVHGGPAHMDDFLATALVMGAHSICPRIVVQRRNATFEDLMDNFRRSFIESIAFPSESVAFPWDWVSLKPVVPVREATVDMVDEGNKIVVHAELPGVAKDKIDVALTNNGIEISAETDVETQDKEKNFVVRERVYSHIYKQLSFPEEVIPEKAESTFRDGLLEVSIPKKTIAPAPKKHKVIVK